MSHRVPRSGGCGPGSDAHSARSVNQTCRIRPPDRTNEAAMRVLVRVSRRGGQHATPGGSCPRPPGCVPVNQIWHMSESYPDGNINASNRIRRRADYASTTAPASPAATGQERRSPGGTEGDTQGGPTQRRSRRQGGSQNTSTSTEGAQRQRSGRPTRPRCSTGATTCRHRRRPAHRDPCRWRRTRTGCSWPSAAGMAKLVGDA